MSDAAAPLDPAPRESRPAAVAPAAISQADRDELRRQGILLTSIQELYNWGAAIRCGR